MFLLTSCFYESRISNNHLNCCQHWYKAMIQDYAWGNRAPFILGLAELQPMFKEWCPWLCVTVDTEIKPKASALSANSHPRWKEWMDQSCFHKAPHRNSLLGNGLSFWPWQDLTFPATASEKPLFPCHLTIWRKPDRINIPLHFFPYTSILSLVNLLRWPQIRQRQKHQAPDPHTGSWWTVPFRELCSLPFAAGPSSTIAKTLSSRMTCSSEFASCLRHACSEDVSCPPYGSTHRGH